MLKKPFLPVLLLAFVLKTAVAQSDYPGYYTSLAVPEYTTLTIPAELELLGAVFLPDKKNKLWCSSSARVYDVVSGEITPRERQKTDLPSGMQREWLPAPSRDPRWANIRIEAVPRKANVRYIPQLLIQKGSDSMFVRVDFTSYPESNFSFNYPYFWLTMDESDDVSHHQVVKRYDAERHAVEEFAFSLPDRSGFNFSTPICHDSLYIWYHSQEQGLFAFDKRDQRVYHYPYAKFGKWTFLGRDSALLFFCNENANKLLALNKQWMETQRIPFDAGNAYLDLAAYKQLRDSFDFRNTDDLAGFVRGYLTLRQRFGQSANAGIAGDLEELPELLKRRLYNEERFAEHAQNLADIAEADVPKELLLTILEWQMDQRVRRGDLDGYATLHEKIERLMPGYFASEQTVFGLACINKVLMAQHNWQQVRQQVTAPDEQLWRKAELVALLFKGGFCNTELSSGRLKPAINRLPVAFVYADLCRQYPESPLAAQAVCSLVDWSREENVHIPLEIWEAAIVPPKSPCRTEARMALFYTLFYEYENCCPQLLPRAITLGKELLAQHPDYPGWENLKATLGILENEQRGNVDN